MKNFIDDLECDEDSLGDLLMEDNVMNSAPRWVRRALLFYSKPTQTGYEPDESVGQGYWDASPDQRQWQTNNWLCEAWN